ncbi:hypothetical protein GCM10009623_03970 [Nocardioides aestuarii]|uniref:Type IV toxin-antitoxin system AbiEi family antitoxin domain-containing protein n=1 Tax=Nocardioides aestuarii TaxID=252231 RepID=A0ABW4TG89_9ACTN
MRRPPLPSAVPFTTREAETLGHSRKALSRLVDQGELRRLFTGVYVAADVVLDTDLRARSLALVLAPDMVLCDRTAAWIWGVDCFAHAELDGPMPIECVSPRFRRATDRVGCDGGSRDLLPEDWCTVGGVRVTTPLRTALDLTCNLPRRSALGAADALARAHGFTSRDLQRLLPRYRGRRGVVQARQLVPMVDPRAESQPESWMREVLASHEMELPEPQYWVHVDGVPTYRLDLAWARAKVALEYDGEEFHSSPEARERDQRRRAWLRDHGWYVVVLTRESLMIEAVDAWVRELREELARRTRSRRRF